MVSMEYNILRRYRSALIAGSALALIVVAGDRDSILIPSAHADESAVSSQVSVLNAPANTELASEPFEIEGPGFSISVDGERVAGSSIEKKQVATPAKQKVDIQRVTDIDLESVDIQVKFDGLGVEPTLNVSTDDLRHAYQQGQPIKFRASSNYPDWIETSEIRIFREGDEKRGKPLQVLLVDNNQASWVMPQEGDDRYSYVLRVYDKAGRYDETVPLGLSRTSSGFERHEISPEEEPISAGEGEDRTNIRNIPVYGGAVTVFGRNIPPGYTVDTLGERVSIDNENKFVIQRILPPGDHVVEVDVSGTKDGALSFDREIHIPRDEWFYVGLADLTIGKRLGDSALVDSAPGEYDSTYTKGRLAFYLKGKIKGEYILTAAADTGEEELRSLFSNLDEKDPRSVLRRIDPDEFYPVYGDDSVIHQDAPTQGKFYIRLEKGESHALWGNFKTEITGTEFARMERGLYGANVVLKSEEVTSHGEPVAQIEAYAAQPDTLPQRDILRGTGGSVYFLTRQDVTRGSETITIEIRDPVSGIVRSRKVLRYGEDYEIDYIQGVIILNEPLSSTANGTALVREGALGDDVINLVAQYEYTPGLSDVDGYSYGGRAQGWIHDNVKVGVSALVEETGVADNQILEADIEIKLGEKSYVRGEIAESRGPGFGRSNSINGGLTINNTATSGISGQRARAYRGELHIDLSDVHPERRGQIGAYYEKREAGFSSLDYETTTDQKIWGVYAEEEISDTLRYRMGYEDFSDGTGKVNREADIEVEIGLDPHWQLAVGAKHFDIKNPGVANSNGRRTDVAARLTHQPDEDRKGWIFGQATVDRSGDIERNDRIGVGAEVRVSEKVGLKGEVSWGTSGWGGEAGITYDPTADDHYYVGYRVDPDFGRTTSTPLNSRDNSSIVAGSRHRYNEFWSVFLENSYDLTGQSRSLTSTYGVTYTPSALWSVGGGIEYGDVRDPVAGNLDRFAISANVGYNRKDELVWHLKGEARFENSDTRGLDRDTYLLSAGLVYRQDEDWRLLMNIDAAISESNQDAFLDGDYIEASIGYAYRPIDNDRFNALFKYSYLYDLPGADQVTREGSILGPAQRSHILSADFIYDINQYWSVGAKYGFRIGEVSNTRAANDFVKSSAHLGVLRFDWHVVKNWDLLLEGRVLHTPEIDTTDFGAVAAVYRHVGDNFKVGVGYNFGRFSDDVADVTLDDEGVFLNVIGKF